MDGITATESILSEVPFTQVIILSVQSEQDYMRRAMMAGARDFMVKPPFKRGVNCDHSTSLSVCARKAQGFSSGHWLPFLRMRLQDPEALPSTDWQGARILQSEGRGWAARPSRPISRWGLDTEETPHRVG